MNITQEKFKAMNYAHEHSEKVFGHILTVNDACTKYGISLRNTWKLIKEQGLTLEQAVENLLNNDVINYNNEVYMSLTHLCSNHGLQVSTVQQRIYNGWGLYDAIETPIRNVSRNRRILYMGDYYESLTDICREAGIQSTLASSLGQKLNYHTIEAIHILNLFKMSLGMRVDYTLNNIPLCIIDGIVIDSHKDLSNYLGVHESAVLKHKTENPNVDIISILKMMQNEIIYLYAFNNQPITLAKLRELFKTMPKEYSRNIEDYKQPFIKYPKLKEWEFDARCIDTRKVLQMIISKFRLKRPHCYKDNCDRFTLKDVYTELK